VGGQDHEVLEIGRELAAAMPSPARHPLRALDERGMQLASDDEALRAALFRFVDVAPACRNLDDLARHLTGFLETVDDRPPPLEAAMKVAHTRAGRAALGAAAAAAVKHTAHRFIVASDPAGAAGAVRSQWRRGIATSLDLLGEATVTAAEADRYAERCADALRQLSAACADLPARPALERDSVGSVPRANLSVKVSALTPLLRPDAPEPGMADASDRLRRLMMLAGELGAHLHVDMESLDSRDPVLDVVLGLLSEPEFAEVPSAGVVVQAYLRDASGQVERIVAWAREHPRPAPLVVRLVKGAYWDHEVIEAGQHGWAAPVHDDKAECDRSFEALTVRLLEARPHVRVAIASHNLRSVAHAVAANRRTGAPDGDVEFQVLRGLGDDLAHALASRRLRVRAYCPVGDLVAGMAYLVRRLLENTANESFLAERAHGASLDRLLAAP
jgi:proline dehydrogenase